ncbi:MAG: hypothetical protein NTU53_10365, partial [Planctomycetota bacterium]|nr:hypothetical protein [Planctomycetota bacterium]
MAVFRTRPNLKEHLATSALIEHHGCQIFRNAPANWAARSAGGAGGEEVFSGSGVVPQRCTG